MKILRTYLMLSALAMMGLGDRAVAQQAVAQTVAGQTGMQPSFIENRGQWHPDARFLLQAGNLDLWIGDNLIAYDLFQAGSNIPEHPLPLLLDEKSKQVSQSHVRTRTGHVVQLRFDGSSPRRSVHGIGRGNTRYNFIAGNDPGCHTTDVTGYASTRIDNLYDNIDAIFYLDNGLPRYDLVVHPEGNPADIRMHYEGGEKIEIRSDGTLEITTSQGIIRQSDLYAYQIINGKRRRVGCRFAIAADRSIRFIVGKYDRKRPLVIDPIIYSTLLSGVRTGITPLFADFRSMAIDRERNIYIATGGDSALYPITPGAYSRGNRIGTYITKLNATGSDLVYSTFLGTGGAHGITVDGEGNAYITGDASGTIDATPPFPCTPGAFDTTFNGGSDVFVTKLNASGNGLVYSTLIGGSDSEDGRAIAVDSIGNAYIMGRTYSPDFPTTPGAFDATLHSGLTAGFVFKLNPAGTELLYSTLLQGSNATIPGRGIAVDPMGQAVVTGITAADDFPITPNAPQKTIAGNYDGYIAKLNADGSGLVSATYIGGKSYEELTKVALDPEGNILVTGKTESSDYPTTPGAFDRTFSRDEDPSTQDYDVVVTKLSADGGSFIYSTYLGGTEKNYVDFGYALQVDDEGNAYVAGQTGSLDFPTTSNAVQRTYGGDSNVNYLDDDAFITIFSPAGRMLYSSYLGGSKYDAFMAMVIDDEKNIYLTGLTGSDDFPLTSGAYSNSVPAATTFFVTKLGVDIPAAMPGEPGESVAGSILVAPNPASDHLGVSFTLGNPSTITIELYGLDGTLVHTPVQKALYAAGRHFVSIGVTDIAAGTYLLRLKENGRTTEKSVVVVH